MGALHKAYEGYVDNGGKIAIRGFNFQVYLGIFFMLYFHKRDHYFEIILEKDDDISFKDLTTNKNFKIQVKSENLTPVKIISTAKDPKSILGKLIFNSDDYNYVVLAFGQEKGDSIKQICSEENNSFVYQSYTLDCNNYASSEKKISQKIKKNHNKIKTFCNKCSVDSEKILFYEAPFSVSSDNCLNYLCGYSLNDYLGSLKKIEIDRDEILCILGSLYNSIDESSIASTFDNKIFKDIEEKKEEGKLIEDILDEVKKLRGIFHYRKLKNNQPDFIENKEVYINLLKNSTLGKHPLDEPLGCYLKKTSLKIEENLNEISKKRVNIFIIEWYIIYKVIERELTNYEN